jgi:glucokinase
VLECFAGMLGGAAANLAVTLGAFGGIFIGGGIVPRMAEWFALAVPRALRSQGPLHRATWRRSRPT